MKQHNTTLQYPTLSESTPTCQPACRCSLERKGTENNHRWGRRVEWGRGAGRVVAGAGTGAGTGTAARELSRQETKEGGVGTGRQEE